MISHDVGFNTFWSDVTFRLRKLRESRNFNQTEVAKKVGIRQASLNRIENQYDISSMRVFYKLLKCYKVTPEEFFRMKGLVH